MNIRTIFFDLKHEGFEKILWDIIIPSDFQHLKRAVLMNEADIIVVDDMDKLFEYHGRYPKKTFGLITDKSISIELPSNIIIIQIGAVISGLGKLFS